MEPKPAEGKKQVEVKAGEYQKLFRAFAPYLTLGMQLALSVVLFFFFGYWIDNRFNLSPIGQLAGVAIGFVGGLYKFFKTVQALTETDDTNSQHEN